MQDKLCKLSRMAAVVVMFMVAWAGSAWATGVPWQVGDIVVCYGGGNCNVIRIYPGNPPTVQVLDTISSGLLGHNSGVGLNNTLHVLATDDGNGATHSNVVVYSIASINPFNPSVNPLTHTPISTFDGSGGGSGKAAAVAVNSAGHLFVGNSNPASIVELNADGSSTGNVFTFPTSGDCATTTLNSLDIGATGDAIYVTAGDGIIRKVTLPLSGSPTCTQFANFGPQVNLYGIKDIPAGALSGTCGTGSCPGGESVLVVAKGFVDLDTGETGESGETTPDAVNVCTNSLGGSSESCALLLSTAAQPTPLSGAVWAADHRYHASDVGNTILDAFLQVEKIIAPGHSLTDEPAWRHDNQILLENAVIWTNLGAPIAWLPDKSYSAGNLHTDPSGFVQQASTGISGIYANNGEPPWNDGANETTTDGLQWQDSGPAPCANCGPHWSSHTIYLQGAKIVDGIGFFPHYQTAVVGGTSGTQQPAFSHAGGSVFEDDAITWTNLGLPVPWTADMAYAVGTLVSDTGDFIQQVTTAGTSGDDKPNALGQPYLGWNETPGQPTNDGLQWQYQSPSPAVIARYQFPGQDGLQSLALDPLVSNCTGGNPPGTACSINAPPARMVTNSDQTVSPSFWIGDTGSGTIWRQDFAGGTPVSFDAATGGSGVQSVVVYGGESANQPGLASLVVNQPLNSGNSFTESGSFFQNTITSTLSNNDNTQPPSTQVSLYASRVDQTSCFNDPTVGSLLCRATDPTDSTKAFVWKIDIPLNGATALPTSQTLNTAFSGGTNIDPGTDVFVDEQFDDTTFVGTDPGTRTVSVHSLHEIQTANTQSQSQCQFSSPLAGQCYKLNRSTLNFTFSCPGLTPTQLASLNPKLSLVKKNPPQAPQFIPISDKTATNGKAAFRFDKPHNIWTYQLSLSGYLAGTYLGTAFDFANVVPSFTTGTFTLSNACK